MNASRSDRDRCTHFFAIFTEMANFANAVRTAINCIA